MAAMREFLHRLRYKVDAARGRQMCMESVTGLDDESLLAVELEAVQILAEVCLPCPRNALAHPQITRHDGRK